MGQLFLVEPLREILEAIEIYLITAALHLFFLLINCDTYAFACEILSWVDVDLEVELLLK